MEKIYEISENKNMNNEECDYGLFIDLEEKVNESFGFGFDFDFDFDFCNKTKNKHFPFKRRLGNVYYIYTIDEATKEDEYNVFENIKEKDIYLNKYDSLKLHSPIKNKNSLNNFNSIDYDDQINKSNKTNFYEMYNIYTKKNVFIFIYISIVSFIFSKFIK